MKMSTYQIINKRNAKVLFEVEAISRAEAVLIAQPLVGSTVVTAVLL